MSFSGCSISGTTSHGGQEMLNCGRKKPMTQAAQRRGKLTRPPQRGPARPGHVLWTIFIQRHQHPWSVRIHAPLCPQRPQPRPVATQRDATLSWRRVIRQSAWIVAINATYDPQYTGQCALTPGLSYSASGVYNSLPWTVRGKGSPYSNAERRVPELIPVLGNSPTLKTLCFA